jgi:hypothetical protein
MTTWRGLTAIVVALIACGALAPVDLTFAAGDSGASTPSNPESRRQPALRDGHELWATIDVCSSKGSPLIGIRGSMPSDGTSSETMYMLFKVQYLNTKTKKWASLAKGGESKPVKVGAASITRQAGWTFQLAEPSGGSSFQLRGIVEFQWRKGSKVTLSTTRPTSGGHPSAAGAIPRGFSAATCTIH